MKKYKAFIFDLNGTMINDMAYHIKAWHGILNSLGVNISLEETKEQCYGKNEELLERILPGRFSDEETKQMSFEKERQYQQAFKPHLKLIDGLDVFFEKAFKQHIPMAIGSAAIMFNIDFVLDGLNIRKYFSAIVSADNVKESKPNPETFLKCAAALNIAATDCLVFEDAPKGVECAANAGMNCIAITTMHTKEEFSHYKNIIAVLDDYNDYQLQQLV